ncbi:excinuclease Cho [Curvibacter sp. RS43]|uniref:excinuclease Cho n=1 Tax=Curvibacter microcysteis TaxID=3026419 RepID=UPI0023609894|nr:excinuclease Cho [Curvibacter sp. RS43]MDD0808862.1 excinuclease Cho [Curvibacter sp. RS43]
MQLPRRRRADFAPAEAFQYPAHLKAAVADLPAAPGVYVFHGDQENLPLYIGKSVNLRQRVLSHLRNPDEDRLLRQTRRISHIRTAGDIGAQLLEAQMIKTQQPLFNQKLRRNRQLCAWQRQGDGLVLVYSKDLNFATAPELYGLYASRHAAIERLREVADQHRLCCGHLGLEKLPPGKACFRAALRQCAGVCRGDESVAEHDARLLSALRQMQVQCWPHPGAVGLVERDGDFTQIHVLNHWCYLGSVGTLAEAAALSHQAVGFDTDGYQILVRPLMEGRAELLPLLSPGAASAPKPRRRPRASL